MSRYRNCFYYFRGPKNLSREARAAKQLEDNTTKALINVLEHGGAELTESFLGEVIGVEVPKASQAEFFLQEGPEQPADKRLLVGLAVLDQIDPKSWRDEESGGGSRIDGVIHMPGEVTLLLETKVVEQLDGAQLNRHARKWQLSQAAPGTPDDQLPPDWRLITWTDVDRWAQAVSGRQLTPVQAFLVQQLVEFLGFAGLSVSWIYEPQHFDYFEAEPNERDSETGNEIKARLSSIWEQIKEQIGSDEFTRTLGDIYIGNLGTNADHGWAQTHAGDQSGLPNLTVEINANEAMINLVGWFDFQLAKTRQMLRTEAGAKFVAENPDYELVVFKRNGQPSNKSKVVVWKGAKHELISRTPFSSNSSRELAELVDEFEMGLDPKLEKASVHIRRSWPKELAVRNPSLPAEMAAEVRRLLPILEISRSPQVA